MMVLRDWDLALTVDHVLRGQGADPALIRLRRPALADTAAWALVEGVPLIEPAVLYRELEVEQVRHERLILEGGGILTGPLVVQHLAGTKKVMVILCTIGNLLESVTAEVLQSDMLKGLALDGLGSAAVEELAIQACSNLEKQSQMQGLETTIPLSPGMIGWPVDPGQRQVFALVDGSEIGVCLNASLMMSPRKSLSLILGIGEQVKYQGRTCDFCSLKETCRYQDHYPELNP